MPTKYVLQKFIGHWEDILTTFDRNRAVEYMEYNLDADPSSSFRVVQRTDEVITLVEGRPVIPA